MSDLAHASTVSRASAPVVSPKPVASAKRDLSVKPRAGRSPAGIASRSFYSLATFALLVITFVGFHHFYLNGRAYPDRPLAPPIRALLIAHGLTMTSWLVTAMLQPLLIAGRGIRAHMLFGRVAGLLALAVVVLGLWVAIASTRIAPPEMSLFGLNAHQFMVVPVIAVLCFAGFVAVGIWQRKRPAIHKPMMFLATLSAVSAGVGRIEAFNAPFAGTPFEYHLSAFTALLIVGVIIGLAKLIVDRKFDRWYATGLAAMAMAFFLATHVSRTAAWDRFVVWAIG